MYKKWRTEEERIAARHVTQQRYREKHRKEINAKSRTDTLARYHRDLPASRTRMKAYRQRIRLEVIAAYGGECKCCSEQRFEFLALDHINGTTLAQRAAERKSGISWYLGLRREGYPARIRVLCHNCNMALGFYGYCPHQKPNSGIA